MRRLGPGELTDKQLDDLGIDDESFHLYGGLNPDEVDWLCKIASGCGASFTMPYAKLGVSDVALFVEYIETLRCVVTFRVEGGFMLTSEPFDASELLGEPLQGYAQGRHIVKTVYEYIAATIQDWRISFERGHIPGVLGRSPTTLLLPGELADEELTRLGISDRYVVLRNNDHSALAQLAEVLGNAPAYEPLGVRDVRVIYEKVDDEPQFTITFSIGDGTVRLAGEPLDQTDLIDFDCSGFKQARSIIKAVHDRISSMLTAFETRFPSIGDFTGDDICALVQTAAELYHQHGDADDVLSDRQTELALRAFQLTQDETDDEE